MTLHTILPMGSESGTALESAGGGYQFLACISGRGRGDITLLIIPLWSKMYQPLLADVRQFQTADRQSTPALCLQP